MRLIICASNGGAGATRARLVDEARGEFICFFDDDDESLPQRVRSQVAEIERYEAAAGADLVACFASGVNKYESGAEVPVAGIGSRADPPRGLEVVDYLLVNRRRGDRFYGAGVPTCALAVRRSVLLEVGNFDPSLRRLEDVELAVRLGLHGAHFISVPGQLYVRHMTGGADKSHEIEGQAWQRILQKHSGYLTNKGLLYYAVHWARLRYHFLTREVGGFFVELLLLLGRHPALVISHLWRSGRSLLAVRKKTAGGMR